MRKSPLLLALPLLASCAGAHNAKVWQDAANAEARCPSAPPYVPRANCLDPIEMEASGSTWAPGSVGQLRLDTLRLRLAEQLDAGQITLGQAEKQFANLHAQLDAEAVHNAPYLQHATIQWRVTLMGVGAPAPVNTQ